MRLDKSEFKMNPPAATDVSLGDRCAGTRLHCGLRLPVKEDSYREDAKMYPRALDIPDTCLYLLMGDNLRYREELAVLARSTSNIALRLRDRQLLTSLPDISVVTYNTEVFPLTTIIKKRR